MEATEVEDPTDVGSNAENRNPRERLSDSTIVDHNSPQNPVDAGISTAGGLPIAKYDDKDHEISRQQSESHKSPAIEGPAPPLLSSEANSVIASSSLTLGSAESSRPSSPEPHDLMGDVLKLDVDKPVARSYELPYLTEPLRLTGNSQFPQSGKFVTTGVDPSSTKRGLQDSRLGDDMTCSDVNQTRECMTSEVGVLEPENLVTKQHESASVTAGSVLDHDKKFTESEKTGESTSTSEDEVAAPENLAENHDSVRSEASTSGDEKTCPESDQTTINEDQGTAFDHRPNEKHNSSPFELEDSKPFEGKNPSEVKQAAESTPTSEGDTTAPENHADTMRPVEAEDSKLDDEPIFFKVDRSDCETTSIAMDLVRESTSKCAASVSGNHIDQQHGFTSVGLDGSRADDNGAGIDGTHACTSASDREAPGRENQATKQHDSTSAKSEGSRLDVFKVYSDIDESDVATSTNEGETSAHERHTDMLHHSTPANEAGKDVIETFKTESVVTGQEEPLTIDMPISGLRGERAVHTDNADAKLQQDAENVAEHIFVSKDNGAMSHSGALPSDGNESKCDSTACEPVAQDLEVPEKSRSEIQLQKESCEIAAKGFRGDAVPDAAAHAEETLGKCETKVNEVDSNVEFSSGKLGSGDTDKEDTGATKMVKPSKMDNRDTAHESHDASSKVLPAGEVSSQANVPEAENVEAMEVSCLIENTPTEVHERVVVGTRGLVSESVVCGAPVTHPSEGDPESTGLQSPTHTATFGKMAGISDTSMLSENCERTDVPSGAPSTLEMDVANGAEIENLQRMFDLFERDQFGCISASEIITSLRASGFNPSKAEVSRLIESHRVGDSVDFSQFSKLICEYIPEKRPDVVDALKAFDNSDHKVNLADFRRIMMTQGEPLTSEECAHLLEHVHVADGGNISFDDFVDALLHSSLRASPAVF